MKTNTDAKRLLEALERSGLSVDVFIERAESPQRVEAELVSAYFREVRKLREEMLTNMIKGELK